MVNDFDQMKNVFTNMTHDQQEIFHLPALKACVAWVQGITQEAYFTAHITCCGLGVGFYTRSHRNEEKKYNKIVKITIKWMTV